MDLQHPVITQIERTGYPYSERRGMIWTDGLGREVRRGDAIIEFMGEFYKADDLQEDAIEILDKHGATHKIAK